MLLCFGCGLSLFKYVNKRETPPTFWTLLTETCEWVCVSIDLSSHSGADSGGRWLHPLQSELFWRAGVPDPVVAALPGDVHPSTWRHVLHRSVISR